MKAISPNLSQPYLTVDAMALDGSDTYSLSGSQITPRGVCVSCTEEEITSLHGSSSFETQPKFPVLMISLGLYFVSGEVVELETQAQIQSIRRVSQQEFEVHMGFNDMVQDGYRHIARYIVERDALTE
ncbi:hypothetical protein QNI23_009460 [Bermanella sp. WJH001]|uniref:hypothetical protein n=1 Tax=Bermanella sp. WJH001 TaxID=3048005 RepID=UPI0024BEA014|nr:hypothetical protein [Bermanella sp. WJH001]MDJ1537221.1 hypothetical protein [Bermanella sp. WJH001]